MIIKIIVLSFASISRYARGTLLSLNTDKCALINMHKEIAGREKQSFTENIVVQKRVSFDLLYLIIHENKD